MSNGIGSFSSGNTTSGYTTGGLGSLSFNVSGLGRPIYYKNNPSIGIYLGGGFQGRMPQPLIVHDNSSNFAQTRVILREVNNTSTYSGSSNKTKIQTPFRIANNAGDLLSRQGYSCGGGSQASQSRPNVYGLKSSIGSTSSSCRPDVVYSANQINPQIPSATCNGRYVYDGSDYTRFKKLLAMNKTYNDLSFGGNLNNGAQSTIRAAGRY